MNLRTLCTPNAANLCERPRLLGRTTTARLFAGLLTATMALLGDGCDGRGPTPPAQNQAQLQVQAHGSAPGSKDPQKALGGEAGKGGDPSPGCGGDPPPNCKDHLKALGGEAGKGGDPSPGCGGDKALSGEFKVPLGDSPARGGAQPKVTIVAFAEFQCGFCQRVESTLAQLGKQYGEELRVVFKHRPLPFHDRAMPAALAAEAASEQGKFWEMHDALFAAPTQLSDAELESKAQALGLDLARWRAAYRSDRVKARVEADIKLAEQLGVRGTPSFFINGRPLIGAQPLPAFTKAVDEQMDLASTLLKTGVPRGHLYEALTRNGAERAAPPAPEPTEPAHNEVMKVEIGDSPVLGPADAPVTIVAFSDFECPFCSRADATLTRIAEDYKGQVRFVWKDLPLPFHHHAMSAALAAREAKAQGKFWPMQKKLLAGQQALERADLERYAGELGLDLGRFKAALDSQSGKAGVTRDAALAAQVGVRGTPAFFINGTRLVGAQPYPTFKARVDEELKKAEALVGQGVARERIYETLMRTARSTAGAEP